MAAARRQRACGPPAGRGRRVRPHDRRRDLPGPPRPPGPDPVVVPAWRVTSRLRVAGHAARVRTGTLPVGAQGPCRGSARTSRGSWSPAGVGVRVISPESSAAGGHRRAPIVDRRRGVGGRGTAPLPGQDGGHVASLAWSGSGVDARPPRNRMRTPPTARAAHERSVAHPPSEHGSPPRSDQTAAFRTDAAGSRATSDTRGGER